jgi:hypothetical protein
VRGAVQWTYDLRGLDLVAWARRAGAELAVDTAPADSVTVLVGEADPAELGALRETLARAGYRVSELSVLGVRALALARTQGESGAAEGGELPRWS